MQPNDVVLQVGSSAFALLELALIGGTLALLMLGATLIAAWRPKLVSRS